MNRSTVLNVAMAALLIAPATAVAQQNNTTSSSDNTGYGTTGAEFLLLGANARGMALGGGYIAMATEIGGLNANPGALALIKRPGVQGSQLQYVGDTKLNFGGLAIPFGGGSSAIGFSIGSFGFSDQKIYDAQNPDGTGAFYSVQETFVSGTISKNFSDRFSVGITAKGVMDKLGDVSGSAFAVDFGTHFHSQLGGRAVRFAFALTNLGTNLHYSGQALNQKIARKAFPDTLPGDSDVPSGSVPVEYSTSPFSLPTLFRVAVAYDVVAVRDARLTLMGEFNQMRTNKGAYGGGAEFAADHVAGTGFGVALRGSYSSNPSLAYSDKDVVSGSYTKPDDEKKAGLAWGGGISFAAKSGFSVGFDYAWKKVGLLGNVNFYTVSLGW